MWVGGEGGGGVGGARVQVEKVPTYWYLYNADRADDVHGHQENKMKGN